ncbi:MAG: hypothetical protein H0Z34_00990 [Brevibacillus sp.]|nr:hypothetical protein [Brevibacillus sp.]
MLITCREHEWGVFRARFRWPTSDEAVQDRSTTIRGGSVKTMSRCDVMLLPLRFPCGCVVTLAGWPNRSLAKKRPHSSHTFGAAVLLLRPPASGLRSGQPSPIWWLATE